MCATEASDRFLATPEIRGALELESVQAKHRKSPPLAVALALAVGIPLFGGSAVVGGWARYHFGSLPATLAFLRGQSLLLDPQSFDLGSVRPREKRFLTLRAINLTGRTITINGLLGICAHRDGCVLCTNQFPAVVQPRSIHALTLEYEYKGQPEARSIHLMTEAYTEIGNFEIALEGRVHPGAPHGLP
jgi:hypothetical protein